MNPRGRGRFCSAVLALALALVAREAPALDAIAFVSTGSPSETWGSGLGASLSSRLLQLVMFDAELARQGYEDAEGRLLSFSVAAALAPSFGRLTVYAGFGVGVHRQTLGAFSDNGTLTSLLAGAKLRVGLVVLRGEYRTFDLSGTALLPLDHRVYLGGGISF